MSLFKFIKDAGERLFGSGEAQAATPAAGAPAARPDPAAANASAAAAIKTYIEKMQLAPADLAVAFDGATATVTVSGTAPDQATRERILLAAGNVRGVADVDDRMQVASPAPEARFHTVVRGDTLSAIAKTYYGNANRYPAIFEANKPMLSHPDKIYPGQVLRIPALD
ncbi:peptidoglycan-binding protein LysM [Pseudothauera lacus]|uniref:Potassium binding protein Kbp n=1 Tax=Pseudothauera lacus TaxID=2136175 RepID=A0A2T4IGL4_9RHOO|nr:peptidoglycan-binding protein LysM [Pseudothauera lacus]PTD96908.1 peptidoglycan-binding protein LysM [Pseudothauera lacus]